MNMKPIISKELVDMLKKLYPNQLPHNLGVKDTQVAFLQGQQSVIQKLENMLDDELTNEN